MLHQLNDSGEIMGVDVSQYAKELQHVWVGQRTPEDNLPTEPL